MSAPSTPRPSLLYVSGRSDPHSVAAEIAHSAYEGLDVSVRAIGAGAVNQAVKACAIARSFASERGLDLAFRAGFQTVELADRDGNGTAERSAIVLHVFRA